MSSAKEWLSLSRNFPEFMKYRSPFQCIQKPLPGPFARQINQTYTTLPYLLKTYCNFILPPTLRSSMWYILFRPYLCRWRNMSFHFHGVNSGLLFLDSSYYHTHFHVNIYIPSSFAPSLASMTILILRFLSFPLFFIFHRVLFSFVASHNSYLSLSHTFFYLFLYIQFPFASFPDLFVCLHFPSFFSAFPNSFSSPPFSSVDNRSANYPPPPLGIHGPSIIVSEFTPRPH